MSYPMPSPLSPQALLPDHLAAHLWRGHTMGSNAQAGWASGHELLDAELPGGGWPPQTLTEILQPPHGCAAWRLLSPALARFTAAGGLVLLIGPPHLPHLPGLCQLGLLAHQVILVRCASQSERLWATEQAIKARAFTAVLSWLPQARPAQLRRLQACAHQHPGLLFALRPAAAATESSAAPLRVMARVDAEQANLLVDILKRRGALLGRTLTLAAPDLPGLGRDHSSLPVVVPASAEVNTTIRRSRHVTLDRLAVG
jgi:protein ImuA